MFAISTYLSLLGSEEKQSSTDEKYIGLDDGKFVTRKKLCPGISSMKGVGTSIDG